MINYYGNEIHWIPELEKSNKPLYILIAESIERDVKSGKLTSGFKLPPQRIIANYLEINHSTVTKAYKLCEEKGIVKGVIGKGSFISSTDGMPAHVLHHDNNDLIELGMMLPLYEANPFIESCIASIYHSIDYSLTLKYIPSEGLFKHRSIVSKWLQKFHIQTTAENIIITSGSQNALSVILLSLFQKGDRLIVNEFTYTGLNSLAKLFGVILIPIKGDASGICIDELKTTCNRENPKGIYLIPDFHNPTSLSISESKREEIARVIEKNDLFLIEDAIYSFCSQERLKPISALIPDRSIYIHGTSKALSPAFRISYIVAPCHYLKALKHGLNNLSWMASPLTSEIVALLIATSKYDEIIERKLTIIAERNKITDEILSDYNLVPSKTSFFRFLHLPSHLDDRTIEAICLNSGIRVFSSKRFLAGINQNNYNALRISISAPKNKEELIAGLNTLKNIFDASAG